MPSACQTGVGANPVNLCYTTGLGWKSPRHPLQIDHRITGQEPPAGLTVGGPMDNAIDGLKDPFIGPFADARIEGSEGNEDMGWMFGRYGVPLQKPLPHLVPQPQ